MLSSNFETDIPMSAQQIFGGHCWLPWFSLVGEAHFLGGRDVQCGGCSEEKGSHSLEMPTMDILKVEDSIIPSFFCCVCQLW